MNEEEFDVDVFEFSLNSEEIDEFIEKLQELKKTRNKINFEIDDENEIVVCYDEEL
ncbi:MAG: hypothetical protein ABH804_01755 [archaeon]